MGDNADGKPQYKQISGDSDNERNDNIVKAYIESGRILEFLSMADMQRLGLTCSPAEPTEPPATATEEHDQKPKTDFCQYAEAWFMRYKHGTVKENTEYQEHHRLKPWETFFAGRYLEDITTDDIQDYFNANSEKSHTTLHDQKGIMRELMRFAEEEGDIPMGSIKWSRIKEGGNHDEHRKALSEAEYNDIIAHIHDLPNPMEQDIVALLLYLGLRPEEVRGLQWADIDFDNRRINIQRAVTFGGSKGSAIIAEPKTQTSKTWLPMQDALYDILLPHRAEGWIVHEPDGGVMKSDAHFQKIWRHICKQIDLHSMLACEGRKTVATVMIARGADPKSTQRTLRHKNASTTMNIYAEAEPEAFRRSVNLLG